MSRISGIRADRTCCKPRKFSAKSLREKLSQCQSSASASNLKHTVADAQAGAKTLTPPAKHKLGSCNSLFITFRNRRTERLSSGTPFDIENSALIGSQTMLLHTDAHCCANGTPWAASPAVCRTYLPPLVIAGEQHKGLTTLMQQLPFRLFFHQVVLLLLFFLQHCFDFADLFIWPEGSRQTRWHVGLQEALAWLSRPQDRHLSHTCLVVPLVPLVPSCVRRRLPFWLAAALGNKYGPMHNSLRACGQFNSTQPELSLDFCGGCHCFFFLFTLRLYFLCSLLLPVNRHDKAAQLVLCGSRSGRNCHKRGLNLAWILVAA